MVAVILAFSLDRIILILNGSDEQLAPSLQRRVDIIASGLYLVVVVAMLWSLTRISRTISGIGFIGLKRCTLRVHFFLYTTLVIGLVFFVVTAAVNESKPDPVTNSLENCASLLKNIFIVATNTL